MSDMGHDDEFDEFDVPPEQIDKVIDEGDPVEFGSRVEWTELYIVAAAAATRGGSTEVRTVPVYASPSVTVSDARHDVAPVSR